MYAMMCTRPDIAHAISLASRFQSNLGLEYRIVVKNMLKCLRRTKDLFLIYGGGDLQLDSYFQSDIDDRKSMSGFMFICNGGAVSQIFRLYCSLHFF